VSGSVSGIDLVVLAASSGGFEASLELLSCLPSDFGAPVVVVQHRSAHPDVLVALLRRHTLLAMTAARIGVQPGAGVVYVADPGWQLVLGSDGRFADAGGATRSCRADAVLTTAAAVHRERLVAAILSGRLDDGASGVVAVKRAGGRVFAQDRDSAAAYGMPSAALATGCVDFALPPRGIAAALIGLTTVPATALSAA
jgi:two-component system chemotaxis response regulator CheB